MPVAADGMVNFCCAPGCSNRSNRDKDVRYRRFPKDPKQRRKWLKGNNTLQSSLAQPETLAGSLHGLATYDYSTVFGR